MNDFAFVAIIVAFFALAVLFVAACDRIIGRSDDEIVDKPDVPADAQQVAA